MKTPATPAAGKSPYAAAKERKNMNLQILKILTAAAAAALAFSAFSAPNPEAKMHRLSSTVEKERPKLDGETARLIAACRKNPSGGNMAALKKRVEENYDKVLARKKAKLEDLKKTAKEPSKVREMREIVDEMIRDRDLRVERTVRRFADPRLRPGAREPKDGYLPVLGAAQNVCISYAPVTNAEYRAFLKSAGKSVADNPAGAGHPAVNVSREEAEAYCKWLSRKDGNAAYRLPTVEEWELAAGHMPKDADFNCGVGGGTTPVGAYAKTLSACGAADMWGNCWEWTSTDAYGRGGEKLAEVKGGAFDSARSECRTERRGEMRNPSKGYPNVGFRIVRIK